MTAPARLDAEPLLALPPGEARVMVADFCGFYANVLGDQRLGLCLMAAYWMRECGLTVAELRAVLRDVMRPEAVARVRHRGELNAAVGDAADRVIKARRAKDAAAKYKPEAFARAPGDMESIRDILARRKP